MRRLSTLVLLVFAVAALAACSAGAAPGWTYAPAPSATPAGSGAAAGAPSAGATASSAAEPTPAAGTPAPSASGAVASGGAGSAAPSGGAGGLTVTAPAGAATSGWDPATLQTAGGTAFSLTFDNQDNTAPHNLILQNPDGSNVAVQGDTQFFTGPGQRVYQVPALTAGDYKYICQVHPTTMIGTLTVQ